MLQNIKEIPCDTNFLERKYTWEEVCDNCGTLVGFGTAKLYQKPYLKKQVLCKDCIKEVKRLKNYGNDLSKT